MTMSKIAKLAGVSVATVSKALTNSKEISRETAEKILQIARDTGYFSERQKRRQDNRKSDSPQIALLCPEIVSPYYASQATVFREEITRLGGEVQIFISSFEKEQILAMIRRLVEENTVDGILVQSPPPENMPHPLPIPVVFIGYGEANHFDLVHSSNTGLLHAIQHLKELGHTAIGFVGEPLTTLKEKHFCSFLEKEALPLREDFLYIVDKRFEEIGWQAAQTISRQAERPTALIVAYDEVAFGLIRGLQEHGISVPKDISVIGMNDIPTAAYCEPPLTTIRYHIEEQYNIAAQLLYRKIQNPKYTVIQNIQVETELVLRASTAPPKKL